MRKRLLLVEDDPHSRRGLQASLVAEGHAVEAVSDGWEAFQKIKDGLFDLAIVDLDLPPVFGVAVTGWDVVRIVRGYFPDIPVIMVSAQDDLDIRRAARRFKVSAFMVKPISPAALKAFIRDVDGESTPAAALDASVC